MLSEIFKQNVKWNIVQIAVQVAQAERVKGRAKSGFYKAATMLAASVVEALAFKLLEVNRGVDMPLEDWRCIESNPLPKKYVVDGAQLSICKRIQHKFQLKKHTDFKKVNEVNRKLGIFSKKSKKLENSETKSTFKGSIGQTEVTQKKN